MITLAEAQALIESEVSPLAWTTVPLSEAAGCALAADIVAPINVPEFASSSMDGIAFRGSDLQGSGPWRLPLQATIAAGDHSERPLQFGHAVKIMTGAPLPAGADTIIPVEHVKFEHGKAIFEKPTELEDFVRPRGDDIKKGQTLYNKGSILGAADLGVLASIGLAAADVIPRPRIAPFSTGSEVIEPGEPLQPGQIYDTNNVVLRALLTGHGHKLDSNKRVIDDEPATIATELSGCLEQYDLVITTGGVSMGDFDHIPQVVRRLGGEVIFHKVAIKPGKPALLARFGPKWLLGLPGNPVSVIAGYHLFARRVIAKLMGQDYCPRHAITILGSAVAIDGDRLCLVAAKFEEGPDGRIIASPSNRQKSNRLSSAMGLEGFVFIAGGTKTVPAGAEAYAEWI